MNPIDLAEIDYLRSTAQKLREARHGQKGSVVDAACQFLCVSKAELYRRLDTVGYTSERKTRSDKGKSSISAEVAKEIGGLLMTSKRGNDKQLASIKGVNQLLRDNGVNLNVSDTTVARALKRHHFHPEQLSVPSAHIRQRSLHPNHVWQIDASVCVLFYLPKGGVRIMEEKEFYKNKPDNFDKIARERVIRYVITDHYSGWLYVEYVGGSEDSNNLIHCFLNAIQHRNRQEPMHGVPHILVMDKGSANLSGYFLNLLDRLQVQHIEHAAGNPRAKGQVECAQNIVERSFESLLKIGKMAEISSINELNEHAAKWRAAFNQASVHTRTKKTRNQVWMTIKSEQLRIAPPIELCRELVTTVPKKATVRGDLTVTHSVKGFGNQSYDVRHIPNAFVKAQLDIVVNPYRAPDIDILATDEQGNPVTYTVSPQKLDAVSRLPLEAPIIGQRMESVPDGVADSNRKAIAKAAYGVETEAEVSNALKKRQGAYSHLDPMATINAVYIPDHLPRAGEQLVTEQNKRELAPLNHVDAAKQIKGLLEAQGFAELWTAHSYQYLVKTYPQNVPVEAVPIVAQTLIDNQNTTTNVTFLRAINQ